MLINKSRLFLQGFLNENVGPPKIIDLSLIFEQNKHAVHVSISSASLKA